MPTISFPFDNYKITSTDWSNFKISAPKINEEYEWNGADVITLINKIKEHPISRLISVPLMFSFHKKRVAEAFPEYANAIHCVAAALDMLATIDEIYSYVPKELE